MGNSYLPNSLNLNNITKCAVDIYIYIYIYTIPYASKLLYEI